MQSWTQENSCLREAIIFATNPDLICLTETHLTHDASITLPGYKWYGHNRLNLHVRAKSGSGGCGILVKDTLLEEFAVSLVDKTKEGIISVVFKNKSTNFSFVVYCCYLPPGDSTRGRDAVDFFAYILSDLYFQSECDMVFLCGDINARVLDMCDTIPEIDNICNRKSLDTVKNSHGECFIEFLKDSKMCILNGRVNPDSDDYTFVSHLGKSVVDYIAVDHNTLEHCTNFEVLSMSDCVERFDLLNIMSSKCKPPDHSILLASFNVSPSVQLVNENQEPDITCDCCHKYMRNNFPDAFMSSQLWKQNILNLVEYFENCIKDQESVDMAYDNFLQVLFQEMDSFLKLPSLKGKVRKKFKSYKPYWCDELTELWIKYRDSEKEFKLAKGVQSKRNILYNKFRECQKMFDKELRKREREYNKGKALELETVDINNPRLFWKTIQGLGPRKSKNIPQKVHNNVGVTSNIDVVLQTWKADFASLYNKPVSMQMNESYQNFLQLKAELERNMEREGYMPNPFINRDISEYELDRIVAKLKNKKAMGIDGIPNEIIKCSGVKRLLILYFNICFNMGMIPSLWLKAIIVPIPKSATKDPYVPLNYRGISLLSCVYKLYSGVLNDRIVNYLEDLGFFVEEQNGFRRKRSCQDHLFCITSVIRNRLYNRKPTFAAFVDMQKAFDWIDRDLLFLKLLITNIDGRMYKAIKSMYTNTKGAIKLNSFQTEWFDCASGMRQGDVLSTTLFNIYINDLAKEIKNLNLGIPIDTYNLSILLYADDIVLLSENETNLQCMLDKLHEWCIKWNMKVNEAKTNVVHFRLKKQLKTNYVFHLGEQVLDIKEKYKYLGIVLSEFADFGICSEVLADSAGRALGAVVAKTRYLKDMGFNTYNVLFDTGVLPVLEYGSEIWGYKYYKCTDSIQERAIRFFLGLHRFTPIPALRSEVGWISTQSRRWINMVRFWNRLIEMPEDRLTYRIFKWDLAQVDNGQNWSSELQAIFSVSQLSHVFERKVTCDLEAFKVNCVEYDSGNLCVQVHGKPKLRTYVKYKQDFQTEFYVSCLLPKYQRSVFAKLRCGVLPLKIETGRFTSIELSERICEFCLLGEVEDELHFICKCPLYDNLRFNLYSTVTSEFGNFIDLQDEEKFIYLMQNNHRTATRFCWKAFCIRRQTLFGN